MKGSKRGMLQACSDGQHVLDKYDRDIRHAATGNMPWTSMTVTPCTLQC